MQISSSNSSHSSHSFPRSSSNRLSFLARISSFFSCSCLSAHSAGSSHSEIDGFLDKTHDWFSPDTSLPDKRNVLLSIVTAFQNATPLSSLDDACIILHEKINSNMALSDIISEASLTGTLCLNGCNLVRQHFSGLSLRSVSFDRANLLGVSFMDCDLTDASFRGAILSRTNTSNCNLNRAQFDSSSNTDHRIEQSWGIIGLLPTTNREEHLITPAAA